MGMEDLETVVYSCEEAEAWSENLHGEPGDASGSQADDDGAPASNDTLKWSARIKILTEGSLQQQA
jgi:hypothetical protein